MAWQESRRSTRIALVVAGVGADRGRRPGGGADLEIVERTPPASDADGLFGIVSGRRRGQQRSGGDGPTGVRSVRFLLGWAEIEPSRARSTGSQSDQTIGGLAAHGIQSVPFVFSSPAWVSADPGSASDRHAPSDRAAWTDFLKAAVERYGPGGSYWTDEYNAAVRQRRQAAAGHRVADLERAQPPPLLRARVVGDPSTRSCSESPTRRSPRTDPKAEIVLAGMPGYGKPDTAWRFLDDLYRQPGFADDFDAVALHPYARTWAS